MLPASCLRTTARRAPSLKRAAPPPSRYILPPLYPHRTSSLGGWTGQILPPLLALPCLQSPLLCGQNGQAGGQAGGAVGRQGQPPCLQPPLLTHSHCQLPLLLSFYIPAPYCATFLTPLHLLLEGGGTSAGSLLPHYLPTTCANIRVLISGDVSAQPSTSTRTVFAAAPTVVNAVVVRMWTWFPYLPRLPLPSSPPAAGTPTSVLPTCRAHLSLTTCRTVPIATRFCSYAAWT